ncbi:Kv channel-interacting protein 1-like [Pollicipes pollicipes]|uniref:Kv channel-interacting protein 1-like n=1 Tax=Pollicipes pollicipes TaxID=41117 RepID=UPI0018852F96|nr:Kv channel-interacting protein 1-like [Pollicipes pollicipes]XP_037090445.1 Kv channel-interacting protein 1-like [Pollicipes pollicipes]
MYASVSGHSGGGSGKHFSKKSRSVRQPRSLYRRLVNFVTQYVTGVQFRSDSELEEFEGDQRYHPRDVISLSADTHFSPHEVKRIYRGFKVECPMGVVDEDDFKDIYSRFFPQQSNTSLYAHYVFNTFDVSSPDRVINFEEFLKWLSRLCRGTVEEKLRWMFRLYDINNDGRITRGEMTSVFISIYALLGGVTLGMLQDDSVVSTKVDHVFQRMDTNRDGVVTLDEFLDFCSSDQTVLHSLSQLTTVL